VRQFGLIESHRSAVSAASLTITSLKLSPETIAATASANRGNPRSPEARARMSAGQKARWAARRLIAANLNQLGPARQYLAGRPSSRQHRARRENESRKRLFRAACSWPAAPPQRLKRRVVPIALPILPSLQLGQIPIELKRASVRKDKQRGAKPIVPPANFRGQRGSPLRSQTRVSYRLSWRAYFCCA
jgi:hypothetical protein